MALALQILCPRRTAARTPLTSPARTTRTTRARRRAHPLEDCVIGVARTQVNGARVGLRGGKPSRVRRKVGKGLG
ncbi:hypothetical protein B0H16DRAFT_1548980 [Mycena metata]|uniref:Uncharacterized protein n=1 Tax=Mycena metata TaxID=1033252 RepID=A0AAD7IV43_9AGAR|nr:hypothetical protein B0H16DRAFT_1548980 [Mycena metata]